MKVSLSMSAKLVGHNKFWFLHKRFHQKPSELPRAVPRAHVRRRFPVEENHHTTSETPTKRFFQKKKKKLEISNHFPWCGCHSNVSRARNSTITTNPTHQLRPLLLLNHVPCTATSTPPPIPPPTHHHLGQPTWLND